MKMLYLLCLLIIFSLLTLNIHCVIFTTKCCNNGEELDASLTRCETINVTSGSYSVFSENASSGHVVFDAVINSEITTPTGEQNNADLSWIPEGLKTTFAADSIVVEIGRPDMCSNAKTVRLHLPRDNDRVLWLSDGSLSLNSSTAHGNTQSHLIPRQRFCWDSYSDGNGGRRTAILVCGACDLVRCVKKCCPHGQAIVCRGKKCDCKPNNSPWSPFHQHLPLPEDDFPYEVVIDMNVTCNKGYEPNYNMFLGRPPYMIQRFWEKYLREGELCTDTFVGVMAEPGVGMKRCMRKPPFLKLLDNWLHVPEAVVLGVAVITLLVVPRQKLSPYSHVHDLSLFWHAVCLLVRSVLWTLYLKWWYSCFLIPIFVYFFTVGATLWLNVLCINMVCGFWRPPARPQATGRKAARGRHRLMFAWYSLYAWGVTAAMTGFSAFMWYSLRAPAALLRPTLFETRTCFIEEEGDGKMATFAYYYGPVAWLLLVNALLFAATAARVRYLRSSGGVLKGKESATSSFRSSWSVVIYIKLLWLMGVVEMALEMVTWVSNNHIYYTAVIVSCLDVLRAIAIFVFCCCNKHSLSALRERLRVCAPARLRMCRTQLPSCACAVVFKPWAARARGWTARVGLCCGERAKAEVAPPSVNGRYTSTESETISGISAVSGHI